MRSESWRRNWLVRYCEQNSRSAVGWYYFSPRPPRHLRFDGYVTRSLSVSTDESWDYAD